MKNKDEQFTKHNIRKKKIPFKAVKLYQEEKLVQGPDSDHDHDEHDGVAGHYSKHILLSLNGRVEYQNQIRRLATFVKIGTNDKVEDVSLVLLNPILYNVLENIEAISNIPTDQANLSVGVKFEDHVNMPALLLKRSHDGLVESMTPTDVSSYSALNVSNPIVYNGISIIHDVEGVEHAT